MRQTAGQEQGSEALNGGAVHSCALVYYVHKTLRYSFLAIAAVLLGCGAYSSIRIAYADLLFGRNTTASVRRAAEIDSKNAQYQAWLAERLENEGLDGRPALERAVALNPMDSRVWIRRGLDAETRGDRAAAEPMLLRAAAIDRLMEPRWTLMNFYFRGGEEAQFWRWAKETLAIGYGNRTPVFELCWRMSSDAAAIEARALPPQRAVRLQFVEFLLAKDQAAAAAKLGTRLLDQSAPADTRTFLSCVDRLIGEGAVPLAVTLWKAMCARGLLPACSADVMDGNFEHAPVESSFGWHIPAWPGVTALRMNAPARLRFTFDGQQPESCSVLWQALPVEAGRVYRLRFLYRTQGVQGGSGLRVRTASGSTPELASEAWTTQALEFAAAGAEKLTVEYRRVPGFARIEGTLEVRGFDIEVVR